MRDLIDLAESLNKDERQAISVMRPELCADGWEITKPGFFLTHTAQRLLGRQSDHTWDWCNAAIQELRAQAGLKPKEFKRPADKSKEGFVATSPKVLLHGTSYAALPAIQAQGLTPQVGKFVRSAHANAPALIYAGAMNDLHRVVAAMYYQGGNIHFDSDFFEQTALLLLPNDGKWFKQKAGYESPVGVEGGDFYRSEPIRPTKILTDDALKAFFKNKVGRMPSDFIDFIEKDRMAWRNNP
jgi:hypothetical protein